jgi:acetyl esterase/lipase
MKFPSVLMLRLCTIVVAFVAGLSNLATAAEPVEIKLWEADAPGTPATKPEHEPVLLMSQPSADVATPTGVIVIPGGGYAGLAMDHEGTQIADWLNSLGTIAFILKYRMHGTGHMHPVPMLDGQRAIRTVRARAGEWKIDPAKVVVLGFSAGGHLASTLGTHFDAGNAEAPDSIDRISSRPDFLILCYPVISMTQEFVHAGSRKNLLGDAPDEEALRQLSNELQVTSQTPPTFLFHTNEDAGVLPENSIAFYSALRRAGVPAELHIYEKGRHGVGLAKDVPGTSTWPDRCREWMQFHGLLERK